jgi:hypothetical protein
MKNEKRCKKILHRLKNHNPRAVTQLGLNPKAKAKHIFTALETLSKREPLNKMTTRGPKNRANYRDHHLQTPALFIPFTGTIMNTLLSSL